MEEAVWLTPTEALQRNREGSVPLVFPTLTTLEELAEYRTPVEALVALNGRPVPRRMPHLRRAEGGVGFFLEGEKPEI
jgi:hypothetical protein